MILPLCKSHVGLEPVMWGCIKPHYFLRAGEWCANLAGRGPHRHLMDAQGKWLKTWSKSPADSG